jgi:uncharacterized protein YjbI with pentapeptide repeats
VRGADWYGDDISGQEHTRVAFIGLDLSESTDDGAVFTECTFRDCRFNLSRHTDAAFLNCTFTAARSSRPSSPTASSSAARSSGAPSTCDGRRRGLVVRGAAGADLTRATFRHAACARPT